METKIFAKMPLTSVEIGSKHFPGLLEACEWPLGSWGLSWGLPWDPPGTLLGRLGVPGPDLGVILSFRGLILHRFGIDFGVDFRFELACNLPIESGFELGIDGGGGAHL